MLLTADIGFGNILRFPPRSHAGIAIARLPNEMLAARLTDTIVAAVRGLPDQELAGSLVIIEPGSIRFRPAK